ncbi:MAG: hypothetical protein WCC66_03790 [Rhizobiaceae bacterium]
MSKFDFGAEEAKPQSRFGPIPDEPAELSDEDKSKDAFFVQLAQITEAMIAKHGADFAMGTLILSARFIAEGKPLIKKSGGK